jgi:hypothetical protein
MANITEQVLNEAFDGLTKMITMKEAFDEMLTTASGLIAYRYIIAKHYEDVCAPSKEEMEKLIEEKLNQLSVSFNEEIAKGDPETLAKIKELEDFTFGNKVNIKVMTI